MSMHSLAGRVGPPQFGRRRASPDPAVEPGQDGSASDGELIDAVRKGTPSAAYASLYERHVASANNLARRLAGCQVEADDLVAEAFAKVLGMLRAGRGPDSAFRAYLLTTIRHIAYDKTRQERKIKLTDDVTAVIGVRPETVSVQFSDPAVTGLERSMAATAFTRLPQRWQAVLWHTEIEGLSPAQVAPILGLRPNSVSALARRARQGLCTAYLQAHLRDCDVDEACRQVVDRLGIWARASLYTRDYKRLQAHLAKCGSCRARARDLAETNPTLVHNHT